MPDSQEAVFPAHGLLAEPNLIFHPDRQEDTHKHPLKGLLEFGPYSRSFGLQVFDPIRIAVIFPYGWSSRVEMLLKELEQRHYPRERKAYLTEFLGFSRIFGVRVVRANGQAQVELPGEVDKDIAASKRPHLVLAETIGRAIASLELKRSQFDVLLVLLPEKWSAGYEGGDEEDFDLHDYIKATSASKGIPSQIVLEKGGLDYFCRASVMWRLGIALYVKAGGVPWKLAHAEQDVAYVGLGYAIRSTANKQARFVSCCSQVFDADGAGLEFIGYEAKDPSIEQDNPFLSRVSMMRVMSRSLDLYQKRHAGQKPKRVAVFKSTLFKPEEVDGCFDALHGTESIDLVQVQQDTSWRGIHQEVEGAPSNYPCVRGTYLPLGGREVLLWTQGNAPSAVGGANFFKEGKSIPQPLLLTRFAGHGGWEDSCRWVLGLTKMNWNNDSLYDKLPVTLSYASTLARILKRIPRLTSQPYQFRLFM